MNTRLYDRLVTAVRLLLGAEFFINGLNWWVKLITPYPSISDAGHLPKGDFVAAMIDTGILFHVVKTAELAAGIGLLGNWFVPLALVVVFPVTVNVFIVDAFLHHRLRAFIMGSGAMLMNSFLMLAYLGHYRSMLRLRGVVDELNINAPGSSLRLTRSILSVLAVMVGTVMVAWVVIMIVQHFYSAD
jgi:putative oxidoreductase